MHETNDFPKDPFMLYSFINMKLRDEYSSLDELCQALDYNREVIETILGAAGFSYNEELHKFW